MTAVDTRREVVESVLATIMQDGSDGEVYAEDINAVISGLGISSIVDPNRIGAALERIVTHRKAAEAARTTKSPFAGSNVEYHTREAELALNLLTGYASLS